LAKLSIDWAKVEEKPEKVKKEIEEKNK